MGRLAVPPPHQGREAPDVPSRSDALKLFPERPEGAGDEDRVFQGRDGGSISNNFNRAWNESRKQPGLEWLRVHGLQRMERATGIERAEGSPFPRRRSKLRARGSRSCVL